MANTVELKIKTNGAEEIGKVTNAFTQLKKQYKEAQGELAKFEFGTKGYDEAIKKVQELKGKIGDLQDATKVEGTGIERLGQSFGLLKESILNADLDKAKLAFKGLGQAMNAIPIFLLVEGLKYLYENFDKVVGFAKELFGAFSDDEIAIRKLNAELEKQKAATASASREYKRQIELLEAQGASSHKIIEVKKKMVDVQIAEAIASAKLNIAKVQEIKNNDSVYESYLRFWAEKARQLGQDKEAERLEASIAINKKERAKDAEKAAWESIELIKDLNNQKKVLNAQEVQAEKKHSAEIKAEKLKNWKELEKELSDARIGSAEADERNRKMIADDLKKESDEKLAVEKERLKKQEEEEQKFYDALVEKRKKDAEDAKKAEENKQKGIEDIKKQSLSSLNALSDLYFQLQLNKTAGNAKAELEVRKKQFIAEKAFKVAQIVMDGIQGGMKAYAMNPLPSPIGIISAALQGIAAVAAAAKVIATPFNPGSAGGASVPSSPAGSVGGAGDANQALNKATLFSTGASQSQGITPFGSNSSNGNAPVVKAVVVEQDITNSQARMASIRQRSTI